MNFWESIKDNLDMLTFVFTIKFLIVDTTMLVVWFFTQRHLTEAVWSFKTKEMQIEELVKQIESDSQQFKHQEQTIKRLASELDQYRHAHSGVG